MWVDTVLFGKIEIPNSKEEIEKELVLKKEQFLNYPCRYTQAIIDCLESELDERRKNTNV